MGAGRGREDARAQCVICAKDDDFGHAVSRVAVAQLCESVGYEGAQPSALDALSELAVRYICDLGKASRFYANLSGRTSCSVFDVVQALGDVVESGRGSSALDSSRCGVGSGLVIDIMHYVATVEDAPFAGSLPQFPVVSQAKQRISFASRGNAPPPGKHIPDWLPALPDPLTYVQTPVWNERTSNPREDKVEQARQRRKAERSLLNLQQRLASANTVASSLPNEANAKMEPVTSVVNSSALSSMPSEEIEMLPLLHEDEITVDKKYSVLNVFQPVIEALTNGALDPGNSHLPTERSIFRFGYNKKILDTKIYLGIQSSGMTPSWALGADEKDDKKRRVQHIIRESMDNPQELHQL